VRKAFGKYKLVAEVRPKLALVLHPVLVVESLAALRLLSIVERGFIERLYVLAPKQAELELREAIEATSKIPVSIIDYSGPEGGRDLCEYERKLRVAVRYACENTGIKYLALPQPRDYWIAMAIDGLFSGNPWCFLDAAPRLRARDVVFIKPFYEVLWEDLAAYAYAIGLVAYARRAHGRLGATSINLVKSVAVAGGPELIYSFGQLHANVLDAVGASQCMLCGGYEQYSLWSRLKGLCRTCSSLVNGEAEAKVSRP
jgi:hypothetical protein